MQLINDLFEQRFQPVHALVLYRQTGKGDHEYYAELFNLDETGAPLAPHPLTPSEAFDLSKILATHSTKTPEFLQLDGILPETVLRFAQLPQPCVWWFTGPQSVDLYFSENLSISSGKAPVPALLWKATKTDLWVFALKDPHRPTADTRLFHAPFFNTRRDGNVCMGSTDVQFGGHCTLTSFTTSWESWFFNSYFTHMLVKQSPVKGNIIDLWQRLVGTRAKFPVQQLTPSSFTLQDILQ